MQEATTWVRASATQMPASHTVTTQDSNLEHTGQRDTGQYTLPVRQTTRMRRDRLSYHTGAAQSPNLVWVLQRTKSARHVCPRHHKFGGAHHMAPLRRRGHATQTMGKKRMLATMRHPGVTRQGVYHGLTTHPARYNRSVLPLCLNISLHRVAYSLTSFVGATLQNETPRKECVEGTDMGCI